MHTSSILYGSAAVIAAASVTGGALAALTVDFDAGFVPGNLAGQQNAVFNAGEVTESGFFFNNQSAGIFEVTSGVGVGGSQGLVITNSQPGAELNLAGTDADMGAASFGDPFEGTATVSFDILVGSTSGSGSSTVLNVEAFETGGVRPALLSIRGDGSLRGPIGSTTGDGANPNGFLNLAGVVTAGEFVTLTFTADYTANELTIASTALGSPTTVPFLNSFRQTDTGDGELAGILQLRNASTTSGVTIDNISYTSVPEPGSLALLGIGLACTLARARR